MRGEGLDFVRWGRDRDGVGAIVGGAFLVSFKRF